MRGLGVDWKLRKASRGRSRFRGERALETCRKLKTSWLSRFERKGRHEHFHSLKLKSLRLRKPCDHRICMKISLSFNWFLLILADLPKRIQIRRLFWIKKAFVSLSFFKFRFEIFILLFTQKSMLSAGLVKIKIKFRRLIIIPGQTRNRLTFWRSRNYFLSKFVVIKKYSEISLSWSRKEFRKWKQLLTKWNYCHTCE